jgi:mannose-1-phosphate guanylyltransferase / phosphomannomutase
MKAAILAGGLGTRMHPLTCDIPKPMLPFANKPIMAHTVELLARNGITEIVAILYHQPEVIMNYFGDGSAFGVKMKYIVASRNLGTAGAVKYAEQVLDETFLVISADVFCDFNLKDVIEFHRNKKALVTVTLSRVDNPLPYGIVVTNGDGRVKHFLEKPSWGEVITDTINTGIYIISPIAMRSVPDGKEFDFSKDLFPKLLEAREPIYGYTAEGYWRDIGGIDEYGMSHRDITNGKLKLDSRKIGSNVRISPSAKLIGLVMIDDGSVVGDDVTVENSVIGKNCEISRGTRIVESILWDNVKIEKDGNINRSIIASNSSIGERAMLEEGSVVASNCTLGPDIHIKPYVKIWPGKKIEEGSTVSTSIVWRERWTKKIFGAYGVTGICNVEITPEFAATLGAAYGYMVGKGSRITTSRDCHKSSRMIYRALISGVLSAGVNVSDLEMVPVPINRYELKALKSSGGFHVRKSPFDPTVLDLKFFDSDGMDLPAGKEKTVERLFFGEDFQRAPMDETGELSFPFYRIAEQYKEGFLNFVDKKSLSGKRFNFVVDYAYGGTSQIFPSILGEFNCDAVAINAHVDEAKITKTREEFEQSLRRLSQIVTTLKCDFGIMFDAGGEKIFLVDEEGHVLSGDTTLALMAMLSLKHNLKNVIATPVTSSRVIEDIARSFGGSVIRTRTSARALMEAAQNNDVSFVGERTGGCIFPKFQTSFDSMLSTAKLLEYLCKEDRPIGSILNDIPKTYLTKIEIRCPSNLKGRVMRSVIEETGDNPVELIDGVKVYYKKDWVLVLPHADSPSIVVEVESSDEGSAKKLLDVYATKIRDVCSIEGGKG